MQLRNTEGALLFFHQGRALLKQWNPGLGGPEVFPPAAGCGDAGRRGKGGGSQGRASPEGGPGTVSGATWKSAVQVGSPVGWVRLPTEGRGASYPCSPRIAGGGEGSGGEEGKPAASPTREPRGAESGKKRRRSLRSAGGGGDFPSASGTEGARAGKELGAAGGGRI